MRSSPIRITSNRQHREEKPVDAIEREARDEGLNATGSDSLSGMLESKSTNSEPRTRMRAQLEAMEQELERVLDLCRGVESRTRARFWQPRGRKGEKSTSSGGERRGREHPASQQCIPVRDEEQIRRSMTGEEVSNEACMGSDHTKSGLVEDLTSSLRSCALMHETSDGPAITILSTDFDTCFLSFRERLTTWSNDVLGAKIQQLQVLLREARHDSLSKGGKLAELTRRLRDNERTVQQRVATGVADGAYALTFELESLRGHLLRARAQLRAQEATLRRTIRKEFEDQVKNLELEAIDIKSKFAEYRETLQKRMRHQILEVRKEAMLKLVETGSAPIDAKRHMLKLSREGEENQAIQDANTDLKKTILRIDSMYRIQALEKEANMEKERRALREKIEASAAMWNRVAKMESTEEQLRDDLVATRTQLSEAQNELLNLKREFELAVSAKQNLLTWKVSKTRVIEELEKKIHKLERWSHVDVDGLKEELQTANRELKRVCSLVRRRRS